MMIMDPRWMARRDPMSQGHVMTDLITNYTAYIHFGRLQLSNTNLSISGTMSQSDKCMSQYDAIVSHAH